MNLGPKPHMTPFMFWLLRPSLGQIQFKVQDKVKVQDEFKVQDDFGSQTTYDTMFVWAVQASVRSLAEEEDEDED